jgi:hypothetical protein
MCSSSQSLKHPPEANLVTLKTEAARTTETSEHTTLQGVIATCQVRAAERSANGSVAIWRTAQVQLAMHVVSLRADQTLAWPLSEITWSVRAHCTVSTATGGTWTGKTAQNSGPFRQGTDSTTFRLVRLVSRLFWQVLSNDIFPILVTIFMFMLSHKKKKTIYQFLESLARTKHLAI